MKKGKAKLTGKAMAGRLLCVERGEYSDYSVVGMFVVLVNFDPHVELEQFLAEHPNQREEYCFEDGEFLAALIKRGLLLEIPCSVMHTSNYSSASEFEFFE